MDADADLADSSRCTPKPAPMPASEPLPEDEAREQANAMMALLVPAFEVWFRQH